MLPRFNALMINMAGLDGVESGNRDYQLAARYRKSLMEWFSELDKLGKRIKIQPPGTPTINRLHSALHLSIITYLQTHMFTLQLMPKLRTNAPPPAATPEVLAARAQLPVLREQRALVVGYLDDARRRRRLEDAAALKESVDELDVEIAMLEEAAHPPI
ncbi:carboxypeptidase Y-deficient [Thoreauomyces humboldtii]|nr:carboxypeptidase Y-deficient [Thoreauomyces humboldtii]